MKITREKLMSLWGLVQRLSMEKTNVRFHYAIQKNKRLMADEVQSIQEAGKPVDGMEEFEKARIELCREAAQKDEDGEPEVRGREFVITDEDRPAFEEKLEALKEEHKEMLDEFEKRQKEFEKFLTEEIEIDFVPIKLSNMPESMLGGDMDVLFDLVEDE